MLMPHSRIQRVCGRSRSTKQKLATRAENKQWQKETNGHHCNHHQATTTTTGNGKSSRRQAAGSRHHAAATDWGRQASGLTPEVLPVWVLPLPKSCHWLCVAATSRPAALLVATWLLFCGSTHCCCHRVTEY